MIAERILIPLLNKLLGMKSPYLNATGKRRKPLHECELVIVGNIRNGAKTIGHEIECLCQATQNFRRVSFFIVESDSSDDTVGKLELLKSTIPNFEFATMGSLSTQMPKRTQRLAHCRNRALQEVFTNKSYASIDYVAVADLDGVNEILSAEAIQTCWDTDVAWDVVTANQEGLYYDIWTLRHPDWCPGDCWKQYRQLLGHFGREEAAEVAVASKMVHLDRGTGFIEVDSAFGGFGIYERNAYISGRYNGLDEEGNEISDHIPFHAELKAKGFRIYINAALINAIETTHTALKRWRMRGNSPSADTSSDLRMDENGDVLFPLPNFFLRLPKDHLLPFYRQAHPLYDRFLPHLAKCLAPADIVVDVGANCGDSLAAMCCSNPSLHYLCIEPDPVFFSYLEKNTHALKEVFPVASIKLLRCLVGEEILCAELVGSGGTKSAVPLARLGTSIPPTANIHHSLSLETIVKTAFSDVDKNVRLIKSDTDGYDYDVINSAGSVLENDQPILFFEAQFGDRHQRDGYTVLFENLTRNGYSDFWVFDNFGNLLLHVNRLVDLAHLLDYVERQNRREATRTVYYYDILACSNEDRSFLVATVDRFVAGAD